MRVPSPPPPPDCQMLPLNIYEAGTIQLNKLASLEKKKDS